MDISIYAEILNIVLPVFLVIGTGYLFSNYKKIDLKSINDLVVYITTPCLVVTSLSSFPIDITIAGKIFLIAGAVLTVSLIIGLLITKLTNLPYEVYVPPLLFGNTGSMGLSLAFFAFGHAGFNVAIICFVSVTILHYSIGVVILSPRKSPVEIFKLPLIYAAFIGLLISVFEYKMPMSIDRSVELLGDISIPAMMFSLGYKLSELRITTVMVSFLFGSLKIILGFCAGVLFVEIFQLEGITAGVVILQCSMPPAVFNFILADKYNRDSKTVASIIMAGTVLSIIAIPLVLTYLLHYR